MKEINLKKAMECQKALNEAAETLKTVAAVCPAQIVIEKEDQVKRLQQELNQACDPINEAIALVQEKAKTRLITAQQIVEKLADIESQLSITKKDMDGIKVFCDLNAQTFPQAYKYTPESTHFIATYKNGYWRLTDIRRDTCTSGKGRIELTEAAKNAIIKNSCKID